MLGLVLDDVTSGGREFHVRDAAAGKTRSPVVWRLVEGTVTTDVDDERRRRRPGRLVTGCRTSARTRPATSLQPTSHQKTLS